MTPAPATRSARFYRVTIAVAIAGIAFVAASGRLAAYVRFFLDVARARAAPNDALADHRTTAVLWLASLAPLLYASWELGRQHVRGRRHGYAVLVGLAAVLRIAFRGALAPTAARAFGDAPPDRSSRAALWGGLLGALLPVFFLAAAPPLRTPGGVVWLCGAGALVGAAEFFRRRAIAYLRDEPRDLLRTYRLFNPARYEPRGRAFVKLQIAATVALAAWWLVGGALLVT